MIEHRNTKKVKFAIQTEGSDITYIAWLYRYKEHGSMQVPMFSILKREAAGTVRDIHDRMPIILDNDQILREKALKEAQHKIENNRILLKNYGLL